MTYLLPSALLRRAKTTYIACLGALLLIPSLTYAQPPADPSGGFKYVFRVDTRPPDDVFRDGFRSQGQTVDLIAHTTGRSCLIDSDSWVSTTRSLDELRRFIGRQLSSGQLTSTAGRLNARVYTIRLDHTFVNVDAAFDQAIAAARAGQLGYPTIYASVLQRLVFLHTIGPQGEMVALRSIAPQRVISSLDIFHDPHSGAIRFDEGTTNAAFVAPNDSEAYVNRVDNSNLLDLIPIRSIFEASLSPAVSTCFQTCDNAESSARRKRSLTFNAAKHCQAEPNVAQRLIGTDE